MTYLTYGYTECCKSHLTLLKKIIYFFKIPVFKWYEYLNFPTNVPVQGDMAHSKNFEQIYF